jgi:hypothetical protein
MPDERPAAAAVFLALLVAYLLSLAPDVTLWDSGEFNAAIASLGIPHPPGTPLYVLLARVWSGALGMMPQAAAVNALSAVATAAGCAILARLLARWTGSLAGAVAGGMAAGSMLAVWQNATETEVYALSFLLGLLMVLLGDRAGRTGTARDRALLVYVMALAVPLQISALVAAPTALLLAASPARHGGGPERWSCLWDWCVPRSPWPAQRSLWRVPRCRSSGAASRRPARRPRPRPPRCAPARPWRWSLWCWWRRAPRCSCSCGRRTTRA